MKKNRILNMITINKEKLPLVFLITSLITLYSTAKLGFIDDNAYLSLIGNRSFVEFIKYNYDTWSSRIFGASLHVLISPHHWMWFILNIVVWVILYYSLDKIINDSKSVYVKWAIVLSLLSYRHYYMASAGWIGTTINYSWPLALGVFSLIPFTKILRNIKITSWEWFLFYLALLFASNFEQMTLILGVLYFTFWIYQLLKKESHWPIFIGGILIGINVLLIVFSQGNFSRRVAEVDRWFPEYSTLSNFRLIDLGFSSSLYPVYFKPDVIYLLFALILALLIYKKDGSIKNTIISFIPFSIMIIFGIFNDNINNLFPTIEYINNSLTDIGTGMSFTSAISFIPNIILLIALVSSIYTIYVGFGNSNKSLFLVLIFVLGLLSRMIMALSPTIWASVDRTFIFMQFSFVIVGLFAFNELIILNSINKRVFTYISFIVFVLTFIDNFYNMTFFFR